MNKNLSKLLLLFCLAAVSPARFYAQCPANGIFTRPDSAINTQYPPKVNTFNWLNQKYITNTTYATPGNDSIWNPVYQPDNIIINHLRLATDMKPADGWELLRKDFGFADNGSANNPKAPFCYIIMYNKYSATLRVFVARNTFSSFTNAQISLSMTPQNAANGISESTLLDLSEGLIPLDVPFIPGKRFNGASAFDNNENKWFFADFPMQYDPCTCYYTSQLTVDIRLITNSSINLQGSSTGTIAAISNTQNTLQQDKKTFSFGDLLAGGKKAVEIYKSISSFKDEQLKGLDSAHKNTPTTGTANAAKNGLNLLQQILKGSNFLKSGLQAVPYIGAAVSLINFFTGGGKKATGPQEVQLTPMSINFTTKLSGSIATNYPYGTPLFWNPGAKIQTLFSDYPYYNEIMGVFNLFETPEMKYWRGSRVKLSNASGDWEQLYEFRLTKPIKYVLNPAARLAIQDAQVALVIETGASDPNDNNPYKGDWVFEGKDANTGMFQYRTPYMNISDLNSALNTLTVGGTPGPGDYWQFPEGSAYFKLLVNLKRTLDTAGAQNVLMVLKYPAKFVQSTTKLSTIPPPPGSLFVQATGTEVNTFCTSTAYKSNRVPARLNGGGNNEPPVNIETYITQYQLNPNPAYKQSSLTFNLLKPAVLNIYLTDINGKKIMVQATGKQYFPGICTETLSLEKIAKGIYYVVIERNRSRIVKKLAVQ
jgi:hypothetical protein